MTVLVLTAHCDDTADRVCRAVDARGRECFRTDLGDFPETVSLGARTEGRGWTGWLGDGERRLELKDVESVYWRRPTAFRVPAHLDDQQRRFVATEARQGMSLLTALPVPFVNHPSRIADAELKPHQLRTAEQVGFQVPPTLITSSGTEAREFVGRTGRTVYKPLTATFQHADGAVELVYATLVEADDIDDDDVAMTACQFQAFVDKSHDVRLVAVGVRCFAVAVHAGSARSAVDWRADYTALSYAAVATPPHIAESVARYLASYRLSFGCFDFAVTAGTGEWIFLECGANAQWGWLEHETGLPIADAIARTLIGDDA